MGSGGPSLETIRRATTEDTQFVISTLLDLVATRSVAPGEQEAQRKLAAAARSSHLFAQEVGIPVQQMKHSDRYVEVGLPYDARPNVEIRLPGRGEAASVVLNSHIDTVHPTAGWTHNIDGQLVGSRVYGLGAADAKGCLVAALLAARVLRRLGFAPRGDLVIQSVIEEEGSGNGTLAAIESSTAERFRIAVVLEPTDLQVAYGHRGMLVFDILCRGRAAHGATGGGTNAIVIAADVVRALEELGGSLAGLVKPGYLAPRLNVGVIKGGEEVFTTPDRCLVRFSVRYAPGQRTEVVRRVRRGLNDLGATRGGRSKAVQLVGFDDYDAAEVSPRHGLPRRFFESVQRARPTASLNTLAGTCDARHFVNFARVPAVVFGPGRLEDAHAPEEHVEVGDVLDAAVALAHFVASI